MKAEHRHELKTNALADTMARVMQTVKTGPSRSSLVIGGLLILAAIVAVTGYFIWHGRSEARSALWVKVDDAERRMDAATTSQEVTESLSDFDDLAKKNPGTLAARVLRFDEARTKFHRGLERLYADHDSAVADLNDARELYGKLAAEVSDNDRDGPLLAQEALMNVAKANESLGDVDEALNGYQKLAAKYPKSALGMAADERARYLADDANREKVKQLHDKLEALSKPASKPDDTSGKTHKP